MDMYTDMVIFMQHVILKKTCIIHYPLDWNHICSQEYK